MGLFNKKNKHVNKNDFNPFNLNELKNYIKENTENPNTENVSEIIREIAKPDADQEHLKNGELPWGWLSRNMPVCEPYEKEIVSLAKGLKQLEGSEKIAQLEELIKSYNRYKQFCYSQNECYIKYFSDQWEHCHNSRCSDFEYIIPYIEELNELKKNQDKGEG